MASNYDPGYIEHLYDQNPEKEWQRLVQSPSGEIRLYIHNHYLRTYLAEGMRVLDIGAGPGRFTQLLHEIGCKVVVGDISTRQLDANKAKAVELGFASSVEQWLKLDICDMTELSDDSFDAVVAYGGPLSYVFDRVEDALKECSRILKTDGILCSSVMSLWGAFIELSVRL
jgi:ubiquinone/menaquinone biosynthesis C-methylase UbiE